MLIIEGADQVGKTTAAKRLVELAAEDNRYPIRYSHLKRQNDSFDFFLDYRDIMSKYAVQDRLHLSGIVWHKNVISPARLRLIESWLFGVGSVVIVLVADNDGWYSESLQARAGSHLFSNEANIGANYLFDRLVVGRHETLKPQVDFVWRLTGPDSFPDDIVLRAWLNCWYSRLDELPRHTA